MASVPRVRLTSLLALTLAATLALGGCGSNDAPDAAPAQPTSPPSSPASSPDGATESPSTGPSVAPSPGEPTARPSARPSGRKTGALSPRPRARLTDEHLLTADRMPGLGNEVVWTVRATAPEDPANAPAVGACQKTALGTIGAVSAVRRAFEAPGGITATQVVARFADSRSAWRAHQVLTAWRDDCAERLAYPHAEVGPLRPLRVETGTGETYRAAYGARARDRQRATGFGILRTDDYLTIVEINAGPGDYPDERDPARVAVRRISRTF
jgi:hypothetical protein